MKEEALEKIFDEYEQTDVNDSKLYKGLGLGLSIVRHLVLLMGGNIKVKSKLNIGTTFSVEIPFKKENAIKKLNKENSLETSKVDDTHFNQLDILLADDDELNRIYVSSILDKVNLVAESDGLEALNQLKVKKFDMVLLDINMPNISGKELVERRNLFDKLNRSTPIVAITANASKADINEYQKLGFAAVILKPYTSERLKTIVDSLIKK